MSTLKKEFEFNVEPSDVWKGLTDKDMVKEYFFGTELDAEWKVGGKIFFRGDWDGQKYEDKGIILELDSPHKLTYSYFSSFSQLEDKPENYHNITYLIEPTDSGSKLTIIQEGIQSQEAEQDSGQNWDMVMGGLKKILEEN